MTATPAAIFGADGGNAEFTCTALGGPGNIIHWKKLTNDMLVANSSRLSITDISVLGGGQYQCLVLNQAGNDTVTVTLNGTSHKIIYYTQK